MHNRFHYMNSNMFSTWLIPLIILLVIVLSVYVVKNDSKNKNEDKESALDILDKRYANDELDEEDYLKKKEQLKSKE